MKKLNNQKGAITLYVLVTMMFLIIFLMSIFVLISNRYHTQLEATKEIAKVYDSNLNEIDVYNSFFVYDEVIPIYTKEQLFEIGKENAILIPETGKYYTFSKDAVYILMNDLSFESDEWTPIGEQYSEEGSLLTGRFEGNGKTITVTSSRWDTYEFNMENEYMWILKPTVEITVANAQINLFDDVTTTFTADIGDSEDITGYQWYYNDTAIDGATEPTYSIATTEMTESNYKGGTYKVEVTNKAGIGSAEAIQTVEKTISTATQMKNFANRVNMQHIRFLGDIVTQSADIDLSTVCSATLENWVPIGMFRDGTNQDCFRGTYEGNGYKVTNLYISTDTDTILLGLFSVTWTATIKDLTVEGNITTTLDTTITGGIMGQSSGSVISNCKNYVNITGGSTVGGIVGYTNVGGQTIINDCKNYGTISANTYVGGISGVGYATIENCENYGNVTGSYSGGITSNTNTTTKITGCINHAEVQGNFIGGIVYRNYGIISKCVNKGNVMTNILETESTHILIGGIAVYNCATIEQCANEAPINAVSGISNGLIRMGGIVGESISDSITQKCYNKGNLVADSQNNDTSIMSTVNIGGIIGMAQGSINNCYNTGNIIGNKKTGGNSMCVAGIAGYISSTISNCYNIGTLTATREDGVTALVEICGIAPSGGTINNTYYLEGITIGGISGVDIEGEAEAKSSDYMKSSDFVTLLGADNWKIVSGKNDGYPILSWQ